MRNKEAGQALIIVTLSLTMLFGMIGLAADLGWSYYRRQAAETAAEAAAIGAAAATTTNSTISCGNSVCQATTACPANVTSPTTNILAGCLYAKANGFLNSGRQTVKIASDLSNPPTATGVSTLYWVTATVTEQNTQLFSGLLGGHTLGGVTAQATAGVFQGVTPNCVYVLDPHASNALWITGATIQTGCGIYVNSNSATSVTVNGSGHANAPVINTVGGYQNCNINNECYYSSGWPRTNQPSVSDPFATLPAPTYSGCGTYPNGSSGNLNLNQGTFTLNPGVYCKGININGNAQVTFTSGIYILNGGGLSITSQNASAAGSGVMFYNTANGNTYDRILIQGQPPVNFSAPTTGPYAGLLFYQDRTITSSLQNEIDGQANPKMIGSVYFPTTPLLISGGVINTPFVGKVVARTLTVNGANNVFVSPNGPANGTGGASLYAALIQ